MDYFQAWMNTALTNFVYLQLPNVISSLICAFLPETQIVVILQYLQDTLGTNVITTHTLQCCMLFEDLLMDHNNVVCIPTELVLKLLCINQFACTKSQSEIDFVHLKTKIKILAFKVRFEKAQRKPKTSIDSLVSELKLAIGLKEFCETCISVCARIYLFCAKWLYKFAISF